MNKKLAIAALTVAVLAISSGATFAKPNSEEQKAALKPIELKKQTRQEVQRPFKKRSAAKQAEIDAYLKADDARQKRGHPALKPWDGK